MNKLVSCRCCLKEVNDDAELHEFSSEVAMDAENFIKISLCYESVISINVNDNEKICSECLSDLKYCYLFKTKCEESARIYDLVVEEEELELIEEIDEIEEQPYEIEGGNIKLEEVHGFVDEYLAEEFVEAHEGEMETDEEQRKSFEQAPPNKRSRVGVIKADQHQETSYKCELCAKTFDRKEYYRRHYRRAHMSDENESSEAKKATIFQCDLCGKISTSYSDHEHHQREHDGELRFKCSECSMRFASKAEARKHTNETHTKSPDNKPFVCDSCSKSFKNRYQLVLHNRSHTGEKPFECPICSKTFSMSSNLQKHFDTHSTENAYSCSLCNQTFKTQRSLKFHEICKHHTNAKVICPICDKPFVNKSYLKVHMVYHNGEKNFTCTICNSKYYKSSHLKRHIQNVHFKLRLMKCDYCASDFVRKETYKSHIVSHHKRDMTEKEFQDVMEKIRTFQLPHLDIDKFTVEKQARRLGNETVVINENEMQTDTVFDDQSAVEEEYDIYEETEEVDQKAS